MTRRHLIKATDLIGGTLCVLAMAIVLLGSTDRALMTDVAEYILWAFIFAGQAYLLYSAAVFFARKLGFTRRMTLMGRAAQWCVVQLFGSCPDDFGEFRSTRFRKIDRPP